MHCGRGCGWWSFDGAAHRKLEQIIGRRLTLLPHAPGERNGESMQYFITSTKNQQKIIDNRKNICYNINANTQNNKKEDLNTVMKLFTRIMTLVLALLMISAMVIACANPSDDSTDTTTSDQQQGNQGNNDPTGDNVDSNLDENGFIKDNLPDSINYKNAEVMVLHWNAERDEFTSEGISGDNILDAIWERNLAIEERLGVRLAFEEQKGNSSNVNNFVQFVNNSFQAGDKTYDIIATYSRTAGQLAYKGFLADLNSVEDSYLDLEMPWWPAALVDTVGVGDALYYVSGDASVNTMHFMYTLYYNQTKLLDLGLTDPTEYVENHTWTIDKLIEMTSDQYADLDQNAKLSDDDQYGFATIYYGADAFYTGSGLKLVERTDDGSLLKISDDYYSEKTVSLVDKLGKWMTTDSCYISRNGAAVSGWQVPFVNGNCLFIQNRVYMADNKHNSGLNAVEWTYGLVPTPLYDEGQDDYITVVGNPFTLYSIMTDCTEQSMMTAVLECWGSEAYRRTSPALFETNMKYKYSKLDTAAKMFDILRDTQSYDQGRLYSSTLGPYISEIPSKCATTGNSWASQARSLKKTLPKQLDTIIESFQKIQAQS